MLMLFRYLIFKRVPDCRHSHLHALRIGEENLEQFEEILSGVLESLDDGLQHSEQYIYADFALRDLRRSACLVEPGKKLRPCAFLEFDRRDGCDNTSSRVTNKLTEK
jgi:hypothetical protein